MDAGLRVTDGWLTARAIWEGRSVVAEVVERPVLVLIDLETDGSVTGRAYVFGFAAWTLAPIVGCHGS